MIVEKVTAKEAIDWSPHRHAFLNPYNGCAMGCPFCYWLSFPGWEGRIEVRTNIVALLEQYLKAGTHKGFLYLGSVCDPFCELEETYRLTRDCLELIKKYEVPLLITTSASSACLLEYTALLASMPQKVITVVELSRIPYIEEMNRGGRHKGITCANALKEKGLEVWTTLAPVLPAVTDLDLVLKALDPHIPVYIDALDCKEGSIQAEKTMAWIRRDYPEQAERYHSMMLRHDRRYFEKLLQEKAENPRVKTFPFPVE